MSSRIGLDFARHTYPERIPGGPAEPMARNFAYGPVAQNNLPVSGQELNWAVISSDSSSGTDVPITPTTTGILRISGVINLLGVLGDSNTDIQIVVRIDGTPQSVPSTEFGTCAFDGFLAISFDLVTDAMSVDTTYLVSVFLDLSQDQTLALSENGSTIEVQEIFPATG